MRRRLPFVAAEMEKDSMERGRSRGQEMRGVRVMSRRNLNRREGPDSESESAEEEQQPQNEFI